MIDDIIDGILKREGGYSDRAADKGGPTNFGITLTTLSAWRGTACTALDVKNLTAIEAKAIYLDMYVKRPGFGRIQDEGLQAAVVDAGVNHSPARAAKWLQAAVGVKDDGIFGPMSQRAVNGREPRDMRRAFAAARVRFYGRIIADDARNDGRDTQADNAAGWLNRAAEFIEQI